MHWVSPLINILHNVANSPYYIMMVDVIVECGRGIDPPTAYEVLCSYLEMKLEEVRSYINSFHNLWNEYGCTLTVEVLRFDNFF